MFLAIIAAPLTTLPPVRVGQREMYVCKTMSVYRSMLDFQRVIL
jgi:hypothetical protein